MSTLTVAGNIVRIELRFTNSGKAWATGSIAENFKPNNGGEERTTFVDFKVWDTLAENLSELAVGTRVIATGRMETEKWDSNDGPRSKLVFVIQEAGPSARWAKVTATKTPTGNGGATYGNGSSAAQRAAAPEPSEPFGNEDEAPF